MEERTKKLFSKILLTILLLLCLFLLAKLFPYYKGLLVIIWRVLLPFLIAGFIAFLLHPVIEKLHAFPMPRWTAILIIYLSFFGLIGYGLYKGLPHMIRQMKQLNEQIPALTEQYRSFIYQLYEKTAALPEGFHNQLDRSLNRMQEWSTSRLDGVITSFTGIMDVVIIAAVIPVLTFYFLKDFELIKRVMKKLTPKRFQPEGKDMLREMNASLGGYIRGQLLVCLIVGVLAFIGFWVIGIDYPLLLGVIVGATNIIPYFGPLIGAVPAVIIALITSGKMVLFVVIVIVVVQIAEGNLVSPYVVGRTTHIHPILIIFALLVGEEVAGIFGMIVAVPILTCVKVVVQHLWPLTGRD
ncbi:AI-2E family transporter [Thalassobacillus hwangdonensis]|uniref:AI-2E family transporter n=1 Tax=Thalassobacillus hwangdonensis TaxID=546108 RepID=A0ABW3KZ86_9BACI